MEEFTISNWIALASVGLSLIALVKSFLTDRKAKKLVSSHFRPSCVR